MTDALTQQAQSQLCQVRVWYQDYPLLHYRATRAAADRFAAAVQTAGCRVTIEDPDEPLTAQLPPLPCEPLWL